MISKTTSFVGIEGIGKRFFRNWIEWSSYKGLTVDT